MIISCVIAAFNEEKYISRCLNSLGHQELEHNDQLEIIVIDDGSSDDTREKVKNFKNVKLLNKDHEGAGPARNLGVKFARGEILVFVDADMEFEREFVKNLIAPIKLNQVKGTFSRDEYVANWDNPIARCWNWNEDLPEKRRVPVDARGTDFRAILASEFRRVNGFENSGYTDTWSLSKKFGYKPMVANHAKYYHYNPSSLKEAFFQAIWVGKRKYKMGILGYLVALARVSLPVSLIIGLFKSVKFNEPTFLLFKVVWDLGLFWGITDYAVTGRGGK